MCVCGETFAIGSGWVDFRRISNAVVLIFLFPPVPTWHREKYRHVPVEAPSNVKVK